MPAPDLREQTALTAARVRDEYLRTGTVPGQLIRYVQEQVARRGRIISVHEARNVVADHIDAWAEVFLRETDNAADDSKAKRKAQMRQRAADLARERAEREAHQARVMITKQ